MCPSRNDKDLDEFDDLPDDALAQDLDDEPLSDTSYDEAELGDENWEDDQEPAAQPKPKKKKSGLFNLILIGAGVLLFAGFVYVKMFAGAGPAPVVGPEQQAAVADAPVVVDNAPPPPVDTGMPPVPTTDVAVAPTAPAANEPLTPMPDFAAAPAMPEPVTATVPDPVPAIAAPPITDPGTAAPMQVPEIMAAPVIPQKAEIAPEPLAPVASAPAAPALSMTPPADDARIAGIEDRLNTLAASIEQNQAMATGMQAIADQLTALNARLERLENASAAMPQQQMAVPAPAAPAPAITRSAPPPAPTAPVAAAEPAKPRKASAPRPKWSLRAVSNGVAYLAPAKGGDLRPVRVGETLPGLGTVTSIEQVNGNWVVRGSTGRVSQ